MLIWLLLDQKKNNIYIYSDEEEKKEKIVQLKYLVFRVSNLFFLNNFSKLEKRAREKKKSQKERKRGGKEIKKGDNKRRDTLNISIYMKKKKNFFSNKNYKK